MGMRALVFGLTFAAAAWAQAPPGAGAPAVINPKGDTDAQTNREAMLRSAATSSAAELCLFMEGSLRS